MKQQEIDQLTLLQRAAAPTPRFFRTLQVIGVTLMAACGGILGGEIAKPETGEILAGAVQKLPPFVNTLAKYVGFAGALITAIAQFTVTSMGDSEKLKTTSIRK
jgi:hypothetical protein